MGLKVYNSLNNEMEVFEPLQAGKVNMYVCGPTVYNYIHIGNARSIVAFDTIRRYLEYLGYDVNYVSNFTDVDDKMIKAAKEDGITVPEVADKFIKAYFQREPTNDEYRHWRAYIALCAFYWISWGLYKGSVGDDDGFFFLPAYRNFHRFIDEALASYKK